MGYDFHITRKDHWADEEGAEIALEEWIQYAQSDVEIEADPDNPGAENRLVSLPEGVWPLWWDGAGELLSKNPERPMIRKLIAIAAALNARVLGDDGENYGQ